MNTTLIVIISTVILLVIYDVWVIMKKGKYESISAWTIRLFKQYPLIALLFGILIGHLAWSMDSFDWMDKDKLVKKCRELSPE